MKASSLLILAPALILGACAACLAQKPAAPAAPAQLLYADDFEAADSLAGWLPLNGTWALAAEESSILRQTQPTFRGLGQLVRLPANYEVSATVRPTVFSGQWGAGLVAYWQPRAGCYRLSNFGGVMALWRETPADAEVLGAVRLELKSQAYRMRLAVRNEEKATTLRAKLWALGEREPDEWLLAAQDQSKPLRYGRPGLFTGRASAVFSEFAITPLGTPPEPAAPAAPFWPTGNYWHFTGGEWQSASGILRQNVAGSTLGFRSAAYAIATGFTSHTVQVSARADSGSRTVGCGLSACFMDENENYQFGQMNGTSLVLVRNAAGADPVQLATVPFVFRKGLWYILKLQLTPEKGLMRLRGKVWPVRAGEPTAWQIEAVDETAPPLPGGEVGVWCLDDVCSFDDLQVTAP